MDNNSCRVILIEGFLGAGKTTLLQHLIDQFKNYKVGVIENEVGEVNIDSRILESNGIQSYEINNGAIFCSCQNDNFMTALERFSELELDFLFIEAAGIADPSPMLSNIEIINGRINNPYHYLGGICVLDAMYCLELVEIIPVIEKQIRYASLILINKCDLVDEKLIDNIKRRITVYNSWTPIFPTINCQTVQKDIVLNIFSKRLPESGESINQPSSRPQIVYLKSDHPISNQFLQDFLFHISQYTYRIKGFCQIYDSTLNIKNVVVSCVKRQKTVQEWMQPIEQSELILIFSPSSSTEAIIKESWAQRDKYKSNNESELL